MKLKMQLKHIKCIKELEFNFPLEPGIYAITGQNGSGKSTIITSASALFFKMPMDEYFGRPENGSIKFFLDDNFISELYYKGKKWQKNQPEKLQIKGFYEGSIIFGNRFKDTQFNVIKILDNVTPQEVSEANEFVYKRLGEILHNDENYYEKLYILKQEVAKEKRLKSTPYFYKTNSGEIISQLRMSTGENLLISILNSLLLVKNKRTNASENIPRIIFLDEIELALHSAALRRLIIFLKNIAIDLNLSIFFSTHSIELLREIPPQNIFYLSRHINNEEILITNPCYPGYATRSLFSEDGYGDDLVIFVEDDFSKDIIERVLLEKKLINNARIKILPTGGWTNTIIMAYDITSLNIILKHTKIAVILDQDIKKEVPKFISNHKHYSGIHIDYLPIESLEKYLHKNLYVTHNESLFQLLDNYIFVKNPLDEIIKNFKRRKIDERNAKSFYGVLLEELNTLKKGRKELVEIIIRNILEKEHEKITQISTYLSQKINQN